MAMDQKVWKAMEKVDSFCDSHEVFRIAKQRAGERRVVVGICCHKDRSGGVKVSLDDIKKIWKDQMEKHELENTRSDSVDASKLESAVRNI